MEKNWCAGDKAYALYFTQLCYQLPPRAHNLWGIRELRPFKKMCPQPDHFLGVIIVDHYL